MFAIIYNYVYIFCMHILELSTGITQDNYFGPGVGPLEYQLYCNGTENRLVDCPFSYSGSRYSNIGVKCLINISPGNKICPSIDIC